MADPHTGDLKTVVLNDLHESLGGRMVPFGGYALPVQYADGIMAEHKWTRASAGLFDVSHMGPAFLRLATPSGEPEADHAAISALIEPLLSGDIAGLKPGRMRYTLMLNEKGGVVDDLIVSRPAANGLSGTLYLVVNAGTKDADFARIAQAVGEKAKLVRADDGALLALQGPQAVEVLKTIVPGVEELGFMTLASFAYDDAELTISRSGYTGEDGFEILLPAALARPFADTLLADERVKPIGLGARDSLRLEAGLPLYGHDLDETTSPIEADLGFAVSKRRREAGDFPGAARILKEREDGPSRIRVGLVVTGAPAREGAPILSAQGEEIGNVTSGGFAPTLGKAIALGFVDPRFADQGTELGVAVRGRTQTAVVTATPFVPQNYHRKPTKG